MSPDHFTRRYGSTFHIFPAFLPLVELLPWFLTLLGALAGGVQVMSKAMARHKRLRLVALLVSVCLVVAGGLLLWQRTAHRPDESTGSELATTLPQLQRLSTERLQPLASTHLPPLTELWNVPTGHSNLSKPVVKNGQLLVGTWGATVDAYDAVDGHYLWSLQKQEAVFAPPLVTQDRIFVGEGYHTSPVCALTALLPDGTPQWSRNFRSHIESAPTVDAKHHRLWQAGGATGLWALSSETGEKLWWQPLGHMDVSPLYRDGTLFAIAKLKEDEDGTALFALDPDDGDIEWKTPLEGNTMGSLLSAGERIYLSTALGQVGDKNDRDAGWAYSVTRDGSIAWKTKLPAMPLPEGALSRDGSLLLYTLKNGSILALHTADGSIAWNAKIGAEIQTDLALIEDGQEAYVVAIATSGTVSVRALQTGKEYVHFMVESGESTPLYADGVLYITTPSSIRAYAGFGRQ